MNSSEDTLRQNDEATKLILEAIGGLRQEMNQQLTELRQETRQQIGDLRREMNERFTKIEREIEVIKQAQFSFDVRLERVQAMAHAPLSIGHDLKADVKVLRAEVEAWAKDVHKLQGQFT